jgi:phosphoribosylformylglycinamidine synthase
MKPRVCIIKTDGTNCDIETTYAFTKAGADVQNVLIKQLCNRSIVLHDFQIIAIPGGFSYGDDIASGKILAVELLSFLKDELQECLLRDTLIIGICNGFQVLVRTGLLPFRTLGDMHVTLMHNDSGKFECRWVTMVVEKSPCIFTKNLQGNTVSFQVAHGEGKFFCPQQTLEQIETQSLVALRYTQSDQPTQEYPANPNGSLCAIAGICDPSGKIFGLMPHPERSVEKYQHPTWRNRNVIPMGIEIFKNAVEYFM